MNMKLKNINVGTAQDAPAATGLATSGDLAAPLTPKEQIIADANGIIRVKDSLGRVIGVRKLTMSVRRRAFKALSPAAVENQRYLSLVLTAAAVVEIDGQRCDPLAREGNEIVFDALIDRLDDEGFLAVGEALKIHNPPAPDGEDALKNL